MQIFNTIRSILAVGLCLIIYAALLLPHLYLKLVWHKVIRLKGTAHRQNIALWQMRWARIFLGVFTSVMGMRLCYLLPVKQDMPKPSIVVSNHRSMFDILIIKCFMLQMGYQDIRWILKKSLGKIPAVGRACSESACAFIIRGKHPDTLPTIIEKAELAARDNASFVVFPEGTRFKKPKEGSKYQQLLPPKVKGLQVMMQSMPMHSILSMTIDWQGDIGGTGMSNLSALCGRTVTISAEHIDDLTSEDASSWLEEEWRRKDKILSK